MVRLVRLLGLRGLFLAALFPRRRRPCGAAQDDGGVRRGLLRPPAWCLADGCLRRPRGPQDRAHGGRHPDVRRLADHRGAAQLRNHRRCRPDPAGDRAPPAGPVGGRGVWCQRHLPFGDGRAQAARFLVQFPVHHHGDGPASGAGPAGPVANHDGQAGSGSLGLAHSLLHRFCHGGGGVLDPQPDGRKPVLRERQGRRRRAGRDDAPVHPIPEADGNHHPADRRRVTGLLRLHDLHAEIPDRHLRVHRADGYRDNGRSAGGLPLLSAPFFRLSLSLSENAGPASK